MGIKAASLNDWDFERTEAEMDEAADTITALRAEVSNLKGKAKRVLRSRAKVVRHHKDQADTLRAEVERLRAALEPFACDCGPGGEKPCPKPENCRNYRARAALSSADAKEEERIRAENARLEARVKELEDALVDGAGSLAAAISLLEHGGKKAAPSDRMFKMMLKDYRKSLKHIRIALKGE